MPTYEYECPSCGHKWELFQSITADPIKKCPQCGKNKAQRLIGTGSSIIFKGSGFYITDYRSENYKQAAKAESEAASGKKSEKSESKPAESSSSSSAGSKPAAAAAPEKKSRKKSA